MVLSLFLLRPAFPLCVSNTLPCLCAHCVCVAGKDVAAYRSIGHRHKLTLGPKGEPRLVLAKQGSFPM
jgi:hypothetical protein